MSFFPRDLAAPPAATGPVIDWEEPNCLLCGGRRAAPLVEAPDATPGGTGLWFAVVQCQDCGLCFTSPRPTRETILQFYPDRYRPHHARPVRQRWPEWLRWPQAWRHRRKRCQLVTWHGQGRLLDFGCGGGSFMEQMHRRGWQVTGVDISRAAVDRIRRDLKLPALLGSLPHTQLGPASFDVVTMWHSLEHVHAPLTVLRETHRVLAPGGRLFVAVPNIDSLPFRWFGRSWYGLDLPRHLTHFAPWTLRLMLERAGFQVEAARMIRHGDWLRWSARRACQIGAAAWWQHCLACKPAARLASWYSLLTRQADCLLLEARR